MPIPRHQAVLFLTDTQGANCVGCYRNDQLPLQTVHLDRFAAEGVRFTTAYTCSPVCGPARSAIFTGLFPHSNGVLGNNNAPHANIPTIGQRLARHGIATALIGKWHLDGTDYFGDGRCAPGWAPAYWFDGRNYLESLPDDDARDLSRRVLDAGDVARHGITSEFTYAHRIADRAIRFIEEHRDRDFLLVVSIDEPHHPAISPEPYVSAFDALGLPVRNAHDSLADKPRQQQEWAAVSARRLATYLHEEDDGVIFRDPTFFACNSYADSQVGRVLAAIDQYVPNAFTLYTSDHGDMLGSHGLYSKGPAMYEEILRVPFMVRWRGQARAGAVSDGLASHIDIVPTLLDYFGRPIPELLQGRSLIAQCRRPELQVNPCIFGEFNRYEVDHDGFGAFAPIRCVFDGRHKLAINLLESDELYDLATDPGELINRIESGAHREIRGRLHRVLLEWMNRTRDPLRGPHWQRRPWSDRATCSTWQGPTRPRPADDDWYPRVLLYETARPVDRAEIDKPQA